MQWYLLLEEFGKTPPEWRDMETYQQKFLEHGHAEKAKRQEEARKD